MGFSAALAAPLLLALLVLAPSTAALEEGLENAISGRAWADRTNTSYLEYMVWIKDANGNILATGACWSPHTIVTAASVFPNAPAGLSAANRNYVVEWPVDGTTRTSRFIYMDDFATVADRYPIALIRVCPGVGSPRYVNWWRVTQQYPYDDINIFKLAGTAIQTTDGAQTYVGEQCECDFEPKYKRKNYLFCIHPHSDCITAPNEIGAVITRVNGSFIGINLGPGGSSSQPEVGIQIGSDEITSYISSVYPKFPF